MSPFPCPIGEYQDNTAPDNWSDRGECIICEDGTDCQIPEAGGGAVQRDCPKGYYCAIENNVSVKTACEPGTYNNRRGKFLTSIKVLGNTAH